MPDSMLIRAIWNYGIINQAILVLFDFFLDSKISASITMFYALVCSNNRYRKIIEGSYSELFSSKGPTLKQVLLRKMS